MDFQPHVLAVRVHPRVVGAVHELGVQLDRVRGFRLDRPAVGHKGNEEHSAAASSGADVGGGLNHDLESEMEWLGMYRTGIV